MIYELSFRDRCDCFQEEEAVNVARDLRMPQFILEKVKMTASIPKFVYSKPP